MSTLAGITVDAVEQFTMLLTKRAQEFLLSLSVLALGDVLSLSQILTELAALTGCSCLTESAKTLPQSV